MPAQATRYLVAYKLGQYHISIWLNGCRRADSLEEAKQFRVLPCQTLIQPAWRLQCRRFNMINRKNATPPARANSKPDAGSGTGHRLAGTVLVAPS